MLAGGVVVVVAVALGFGALGSPALQRDIRMDERRERDLSALVHRVRRHHRLERVLPADLATLSAQPGSTLATADPVTGVPYEYLVVAPDRFRLCAVFATDTAAEPRRGPRIVGYAHGRGRHCFDERVDADDD
jgi:hypothetical protein